MPTISKQIADDLIAGNGMYPGDHVRVIKIVKYQNVFNGTDAYGAIYEGQSPDLYAETEYVRNPVLYWEYKEKPKTQDFTARQIENWQVYETIRAWGVFNMFSPNARLATGLSVTDYQFCMKNYDALKKAAGAI